METELLYRLALTFVNQVGPRIGRTLIERYGEASAVFKAPLKELKAIEGMSEAKARSFREEVVLQKAEVELTYITKNNIIPVWINDDVYPNKLKNCLDAPLLMYYKGNGDLNTTKQVAVVGTRSNTDYGTKLTEDLIAGLANIEDITIVSGLAAGVDTIAHKAALANKIPTIGVLGHGHDTMYPVGNRNLAKEMQIMGGVLTEYPSGTQGMKENFPQRNRIVAGMCDVTIVVESDIKGGSLITARVANSYNRDVAAFPGRVGDRRSSGCNELIRTNIAAMITKTDDLIELMNWGKDKKTKTVQKHLFVNLSPDEKMIMDILHDKDAVHADELFHKSGMSSSQLAATLLQLEMQGLVKTLPGKMYRVN
ncbi:MAG: DNA-protecting protein DprA [Bacteroidetes bacterium]|nr:DNA-protecting protein DprA [Bacteroidota bacterium]